ncbi:hypothetical protein FCN80_03445 [Martelella alba]|uniref:Uncharacterized protein n=1 Tax=Martelella alba TaxID=2590451 RepID=A0ABY2SR52_9HYPH|nr:hypothetical protein FCN80_03445 [Martelella alba]
MMELIICAEICIFMSSQRKKPLPGSDGARISITTPDRRRPRTEYSDKKSRFCGFLLKISQSQREMGVLRQIFKRPEIGV